MELSQSKISDNRKTWPQYSFVVSLGFAALMFSFVLLSGLMFSSLGLFAMIKDHHKGLGITSLAIGSMLSGIAPLLIH